MGVFMVPNSKGDLLANLTEVMPSFSIEPSYQVLLRSSLQIGRSCQDEIIQSDTQKITLEQMEGFLVIFSILVGLAVVAAFVRAAKLRISGDYKKTEKDLGANPDGL